MLFIIGANPTSLSPDLIYFGLPYVLFFLVGHLTWGISINDEDFKLRNGFENWMDQMNAHVNNDSMPPNDILGSMKIQHYSRMNTEIGGGAWKFTNIFPVNLSEIALDWGSNDTIEEFTVDFAYDFCEHDASTT